MWNAVEKIEKAKNAQLAREIEIALPKELTREQGIPLVREFVKEQFVNAGMCADITQQYHALKDEVKEVEQIRRNVYSIMREENGREQPTRKHEVER